MPYCPTCGAEHSDTATFCTTCGNKLDAVAPPPPPRPTSPPPRPEGRVLPPAPGTPADERVRLAFDWRRLIVGNWFGAAQTALAALLVTGVAAGVLGLLAKPADFGVANTLTLITLIATGSFGADLLGDLHLGVGESSASYSFGAFPLTVTILALAAAALVFRRVVAAYPQPRAAALDAVRAALLFAVGLLVPALVFRSDNDELGSGWGRELSSKSLGFDAKTAASAPGAFFLGFLIMLTVLMLVLLVRRDWWPERVRRAQDWFVAPLYGYATLLLLLVPAGLLGLLSMALFGDPTIEDIDPSGDDSAVAAALTGGLANGGVWLLGLGSGARIGAEFASRGGGDNENDSVWQYLWGDVTDSEPGLWIAPFVLLAALAVCAVVVLRKAPAGLRLPNLITWALGFLVVAPLLVRLSGLHGSIRVEDDSDTYHATYFVGLHGVQATFFLVIAALVVAVLTAAATGSLDVADVRRRAGALAGSIQTNPGRDAPTGGLPSGTPPPPPLGDSPPPREPG